MHRLSGAPLFAFVLSIGLPFGIVAAEDSAKDLPGELILLGVQAEGESHACEIRTLPLAGGEGRTLFRKEGVNIAPGGRLAPERDRLAFCILPDEGSEIGGFWILDSAGEAKRIADGFGMVQAWSPDGKRIAAYRDAEDGDWLESVVVDATTGETAKLDLPRDYVVEDWRASDGMRLAMFRNARNQLYRPIKGDSYPTRQIDLQAPDGNLSPLTKNPSTDNIWSRFSPDGERVAHYSRRLVGEKSLEHVAICDVDGSAWREIFCFTTYGDERGLPWFRPSRPPAWAPDGSAVAWLVNTNDKPEGQDDRLEVVILPVEGGEPTRIDLNDRGIDSVSGIEWR